MSRKARFLGVQPIWKSQPWVSYYPDKPSIMNTGFLIIFFSVSTEIWNFETKTSRTIASLKNDDEYDNSALFLVDENLHLICSWLLNQKLFFLYLKDMLFMWRHMYIYLKFLEFAHFQFLPRFSLMSIYVSIIWNAQLWYVGNIY